MDFVAMLTAAKAAAGGQNALGREVGGSHNIVRQWLAGLGLPSTPEQEAVLGRLVGLSQAEVREIIWAERRRRWEAKRRLGGLPPDGPLSARSRPMVKKPPAKVAADLLHTAKRLVRTRARALAS
jgi:hypothetical protein